jgi:phosphoglycolate phosphatase
MKPHRQAVLFDLDGTLADTLADLADATDAALTALGCPTHPLPNYRHMVGDGARNLCQRALPSDRQDLADQAVRLMRQHYDAHCFDKTRLYDGVPALVAELRRRGLKLAVLSNKPDDFTKRMIAHYFRPNPFDEVRGQLPDVPLKPDPTATSQIADRLGVPPGAWLYLGDTNTDMRAARAAGMFAVGVLWGFRDRQELLDSGAQALVATPAEVLSLL